MNMEPGNHDFENAVSEFKEEIKQDMKKNNPNERGNTILIEGNIKDMHEFLSNIKNDEIIKQSLHSKYDMMCLNSTIHSLEWGIELELEKNESVTIQLYTDIEITDQLKIYLNKYKTLSFDVTIKSKSENLLDKIILYFKYKNGVEIYSEEFDIFTFLYKIKQYPAIEIVSYFISKYNTKFPDFFKTESIRPVYETLKNILDDVEKDELKRKIIKVLDSYQGPSYLVF